MRKFRGQLRDGVEQFDWENNHILCPFRLQTIESGQSTKFLKTILTTTPSTSHISNFRNQPRTDSRADKPDTFPGFDLQDDTTPSPVLKRRQAYSHLLRSFIQKTRERLETIREVARHERALAQARKLGINSVDAMVAVTDEATEVIELALGDDDADDDEVEAYLNEIRSMATEPMADAIDESAPRRYFTTLLTTAGLQRVVAQQRQTEIPAQAPSFIAAYVFNPLLDLWQTARNNFNLNYLNVNSATVNEATNSPGISTPDAGDDANNGENNDEEIAFNSPDNGLNGSATAVNTNNANHSSPFKLNVNSASSMKEMAKEKSHFERATLAFQNAFYKYAGSGGGGAGAPDDDDDHNVDTTNENGSTERVANTVADMQAAAALPFTDPRMAAVDFASSDNATYLNGRANDNGSTTESPNIQIIPSHQNLALKQSNGSMAAVPSAAESAGIYVLEIVGSVVGLTWGAVSQLQNWFNKG